MRVAQKLRYAYETVLKCKSSMTRLVTNPRQCVRPGKVAVISNAPSSTNQKMESRRERSRRPEPACSLGNKVQPSLSVTTSAPLRVDKARHVDNSIGLAVKLTDPSALRVITPPVCRLRAARHPNGV